MYLKGIEVQGFKSFANKMKFEFQNGITCIVGPNGSGKSNVADALRWVLGEQSSKQLRGGSMQDVIFAGTETRKPQGFASVSLVLDNSDHALNIDYEEVTVTRRLYRSGESEYLINQAACRLKDINELFYDTGIGKEGYSIIGQGQIDKILSSKPDDRRELFDEAVGIVKFKHRKNETMRTLMNEQANMQRLSDIMNELEHQVGPLARQAEAAKNYLRLREDLKKNDICVIAVEQKNFDEKIGKIQEDIYVVSGQLDEVNAEQTSAQAQYTDMSAEIKQLEEEIEAEKNEYSQAEVQIKELEGKIGLVKEQIHSEEKSAMYNESRIEQIQKEIEDKEAEQEERFAAIINLSKEIAQKNKEMLAAKERLAQLDEMINGFDQAISGNRQKIIDLMNEKNVSDVSLEKIKTTKEQMLIRKSALSANMLKNKTSQQSVMKDVDSMSRSFETQKKELDDLDAQVEKFRKRESTLTEELHHLSTDLEKSQQSYHAASTKAESLKNIAERYEGYDNSIKRIMEVRKDFPGVCGVVADLIHVDRKYEVAVETALGGSVKNVVTRTEECAKGLIEYLKKNKFGRATFLPLDGISAPRQPLSDVSVLKEQCVIGTADTLVKCEAQYSDLVKYLLGRTVVVDTIDNGLYIARKYRRSLRIVTLEGDQFNPGGSMSGGAFKNSSNLIGRGREIEELEKTAAEALRVYDNLLAKQKALREERENVRAQLNDVSEKRQEAAIRMNTVAMQIKDVENKVNSFQLEEQDINRELMMIDNDVSQMNAQAEEIQKRLKDIEKEDSRSRRDIDDRMSTIDETKEKRVKAQERFNDLSAEVSGLNSKEEYLENDRERVETEIENLENTVDELKSGKKDISGEIGQKERLIESYENKISELKDRMKELNGSFQEKTAIRDGKQEGQNSFVSKFNEISERQGLLLQEKTKLENNLEKEEERMQAQQDYLFEEYEMYPSEAEKMAALYRESPDWENLSVSAMKTAANDIRAQIKKLGNINVNAIDEYKDVSERYEFMKTQYDDLVEGEKNLRDIIDDLDRGMREQFNEQFGKIQVEFDKVFKELFGGGTGTLKLEEGSDVIEGGIYINAQPPGKKLQNMMQLSGGEKALTAIALLFAIQNLKPSPFCLLDEIEAALDDSNVSRYARYLNKLTDHTQFILITHRRGTMVAADRLYGITMQEKGVSTLVSVSLIEKELDA